MIEKTFEPNQENHEIYLRQYQKYKTLFSALSDLFDLDAEIQ